MFFSAAFLPCSPLFSFFSFWSRTGWEGVCWHSCTVCFALDRALALIHNPLLLLWLLPLLLSPPPLNYPSPTPSTLLDCSPNRCSCQQLFDGLHPQLLLLLSPSLILPQVSPMIHCTLPLFSSPLSQPVAAGLASVTQMHTVAVGARHGNKALVGPFCCSVFLRVCATMFTWEKEISEKAEMVHTASY